MAECQGSRKLIGYWLVRAAPERRWFGHDRVAGGNNRSSRAKLEGVAGDVLTKGGNVALLHRSAVEQSRLQAVVRWSNPDGAEVDVAALLLGPDGRVRSDEDFVFYNAPSGGDGAVRLLGKRTGDDSAEDRVAVDLEALPPDIGTVVILASLDAADGVGFGDVAGLALDVVDAGGESQVRFNVAGAGPGDGDGVGRAVSARRRVEVPGGRTGLGLRLGRAGHRLRHRRRRSHRRPLTAPMRRRQATPNRPRQASRRRPSRMSTRACGLASRSSRWSWLTWTR